MKDELKEYGMMRSISRRGNWWDNAPTESWFGSFENERVHRELQNILMFTKLVAIISARGSMKHAA